MTVPAPRDLTPQQVCQLVEAGDIANAFAVFSADATPASNGLALCSYEFMSSGQYASIFVRVVRSADVGGRSPPRAFKYTVEQTRQSLDGARETRIRGLGDAAVFMSGVTDKVLIVQAGPRVLVVQGKVLADDTAAAIARTAIDGLQALEPASTTEQ
jgi:hypothetical protein